MTLTQHQKNELNGMINGIQFNHGGYNKIHQWVESLVDEELAKLRPQPSQPPSTPHELHPSPVTPVGPGKAPKKKKAKNAKAD